MNFLKIKLLVIAAFIFAASSAFASMSTTYDVTVNTSSIAGDNGYLYLQYLSTGSAVASTATVSTFDSDAVLGAQDTIDVSFGNTTGTLPGSVAFASAGSDYNHAVTTFGNSLSFLVTLTSTTGANKPSAVSTFSVGVFGDAYGTTPLLNVNDPNVAGTVAMINLNNDGTTSATLDASTSAAPTPIPGALYLLGSGLMGLVGMRRKKQN